MANEINVQLMNKVMHLAAKEPDISLENWKRPKQRFISQKSCNFKKIDRSNLKLQMWWRLHFESPVSSFVFYSTKQSHRIHVIIYDYLITDFYEQVS